MNNPHFCHYSLVLCSERSYELKRFTWFAPLFSVLLFIITHDTIRNVSLSLYAQCWVMLFWCMCYELLWCSWTTYKYLYSSKFYSRVLNLFFAFKLQNLTMYGSFKDLLLNIFCLDVSQWWLKISILLPSDTLFFHDSCRNFFYLQKLQLTYLGRFKSLTPPLSIFFLFLFSFFSLFSYSMRKLSCRFLSMSFST